ncbi:YdeI/OmpD-associated family protein [Xanthomarina sp. F2636L]|uniref:YdeI/OmpD-associated family protein n=1 Tax=Xanthomarina sp. F2636L TaxID=2996018 RepID=UPI00225E64B9|nr:DUF1801 domain-containing protein [Xanthomarina sp. F2636L]MCX7550221.1 YdeI/OmpD-associated family protein [Xanthomarina sp. F2636L]
MKKASSIEEYIEINPLYKEALELLRQLINSTELEETFKWSSPVYTLDGKNVLGLGAFKNHFGIWFFNGVFLKDEKQLLEKAQETTKALRQMRFENIRDINKSIVLNYIHEAIENQKSGKILEPERRGKSVIIPKELQQELKSKPKLLAAFKTLAPGKQREYCHYVDSAKRETTKHSRLVKIKPMIIQGLGLHDKYKNC